VQIEDGIAADEVFTTPDGRSGGAAARVHRGQRAAASPNLDVLRQAVTGQRSAPPLRNLSSSA
jgi:hypothetical protein